MNYIPTFLTSGLNQVESRFFFFNQMHVFIRLNLVQHRWTPPFFSRFSQFFGAQEIIKISQPGAHRNAPARAPQWPPPPCSTCRAASPPHAGGVAQRAAGSQVQLGWDDDPIGKKLRDFTKKHGKPWGKIWIKYGKNWKFSHNENIMLYLL